MPQLVPQPDGSVLWDYDVPVTEPKKPAKKHPAEPPASSSDDTEKGDD